ncbi:F-box-like domain-containing protein [Ceratobasidium sp. AG-Ba]|nr:F-box-like domain-containing protein [Ceratobasidium sp. AG-Ba]
MAIPEICMAIVAHYTNDIVNTLHVRQYRHGKETPSQREALIQLMLVSKDFCLWVCQDWNRRWLRTTATGARTLAYPIVLFELCRYPIDLSRFDNLRYFSLNLERAFRYRDGSWELLECRAVLPPSIEEIEFLWAHATGHEMLGIVKRYCPRITTLRIVPCTLFNNPSCVWWSCHQLEADHDHYLMGDSVTRAYEYVMTIIPELRDMPNLKILHIGSYFVPFEAITAHRFSEEHMRHHPRAFGDSTEWFDGIHIQNVAQFQAKWSIENPGYPFPNTELAPLAARELWTTPCPPCIERWSKTSEGAERSAASLLAAEIPSLELVSFGSFVAEHRRTPSEWSIGRIHAAPSPDGNERVWIRTKHPYAPCSSSVRLMFEQSGSSWVHVD